MTDDSPTTPNGGADPTQPLSTGAEPTRAHPRSPIRERAASVEVEGFRIEGTLGRGGMGVVYRAVSEGDGSPVALKMVKVPHPSLLGGIRREIQALTRLRHPGIVSVVAHGIQDGMPWYAMPLCPGTNLLDAADERPEEPGTLVRALSLVRRLCHPLRYMHGEGMVHRDLKPANILVDPRGAPLIIDFGLTMTLSPDASRDELDPSAIESGTLGYMAPEQLRGLDVDARTDLYALGCILYELIAGRRPFEGGAPAAVAWQHMSVEPDPPSTHNSAVSPALDALVLRLLHKDPDARFGYADDVARELRSLGAENGCFASAPVGRTYLYRPRLTGRASVLERITPWLDAARNGRPSLIFLAGEPGIGKTRLAAEVVRQARSRELAVVGGTVPATPSPLSAFRPLLQAVADRCHGGGPDATRRLLGPRAAVLAAFEPALCDLPGVDPSAPPELSPDKGRQRVLTYLCEVVRELAREQPLLLVVDDLGSADELSLDALAQLRRSLDTTALGVTTVATCLPPAAGSDLERLVAAADLRVDLPRLQTDDVGAMISGMLALPTAAEALSRFLMQHSEGNPLFVSAYLRTAVEAGLLARDDSGRWGVAGSEAERWESLPLPTVARDLLRSQLQGLSSELQDTLLAASILGDHAETELVRELNGLSEAQLLDHVGELERRRILREDDGVLRFSHQKTAELVYGEARDERRADLHRRAAAGLERLPIARRGDALAQLAHHYQRSGQDELARTRTLEAAERAARLYAHDEAERLYRQFQALVPSPTPRSVKARYDLAQNVLRLRGDVDGARREAVTAAEEASSLGQPCLQADALLLQARLHRMTGNPEAARAGFESAFELCRKADYHTGSILAQGGLGALALDVSDIDRAEELYEAARKLARDIDSPSLEAQYLGNLGNVASMRGNMQLSRERYEDALSTSRQHGHREHEGQCLGYLAYWASEQGRLDEARSHYESALSIAEEIGDRRKEGLLRGNLATLDAEMGRLDAAEAGFEAALAIAREIADRSNACGWVGNLGHLLEERGRPEDARPRYEEALRISRELGDPIREGFWLSSLAQLDSADGELEKAREASRTALRLARKSGRRRFEGIWLGHLAAIQTLMGDPEAASLVEQSMTLLEKLGDDLEVAKVCLLRGHLEVAAGNSARPHLDRARKLADDLGVAQDEGEMREGIARLERAEALRASGGETMRGHDPADLTEGQRRWISGQRDS